MRCEWFKTFLGGPALHQASMAIAESNPQPHTLEPVTPECLGAPPPPNFYLSSVINFLVLRDLTRCTSGACQGDLITSFLLGRLDEW